MRDVVLLLCVLSALACNGGKPNRPKALDTLASVKNNLIEAKTNIEAASYKIDESLNGVSEASQAVKADTKELQAVKNELDKLKSNPWVRFILFVRKWFYIALASYLIVGVLSGILLGRGVFVGLSKMILDLLPLSQMFKLFGSIFAPRKKATSSR